MRGSLDLGTTFAGYLIMSRLGRGGMSVVYLAEQVGLGRKVALKILAPELADDTRFRERFARESKLAASIDHPNVIPIYEAGENDEVLYIAMRFVDGIDLKGLLHQEGHLDAHRAVTIVGQVGSALDAAHQRGLAHRDVKPANILIVPGGSSSGADHAYLADFGLTKHSTSHSSLTMTGQFVGTIDYIAPEQIEGKHVDGRADIYALGCVLYECLTGVPPFQKESDIAVIYAHLRDEPPLVTARRSDLPAAIDAVVAKAMAKNPEERYQTGAALAAAATVALSAPVVAPSPIAASPAADAATLEATQIMARPEAAPAAAAAVEPTIEAQSPAAATVQTAPPVAPTVQAAPPVAPTVPTIPPVAATVQAPPPLAVPSPVSGSGHQAPPAGTPGAPSVPAAIPRFAGPPSIPSGPSAAARAPEQPLSRRLAVSCSANIAVVTAAALLVLGGGTFGLVKALNHDNTTGPIGAGSSSSVSKSTSTGGGTTASGGGTAAFGPVSGDDPNGATRVAQLVFPPGPSNQVCVAALPTCPISDRLERQLAVVAQGRGGNTSQALCRCVNGYVSRTFTIATTSTGAIIHVQMNFNNEPNGVRTIYLDLIVTRNNFDGWFVDDTTCAVDPSTTSIYDNPLQCTLAPS